MTSFLFYRVQPSPMEILRSFPACHQIPYFVYFKGEFFQSSRHFLSLGCAFSCFLRAFSLFFAVRAHWRPALTGLLTLRLSFATMIYLSFYYLITISEKFQMSTCFFTYYLLHNSRVHKEKQVPFDYPQAKYQWLTFRREDHSQFQELPLFQKIAL